MVLEINRIFLSFILLLSISFPQLLNNCGKDLPHDNDSYETYRECNSKLGYDDYFIGDVISTGSPSYDRNAAANDLSSSIGNFIESSLEKTFIENEVSYIVDDIVIDDFNVQHYLIQTFKAESNNYIQNAIYIDLVETSGKRHLLAFKNKEEFKQEGDNLNEFILEELSNNLEIYKNSRDNRDRYRAIFTSFLLGNCISGGSIGGDNKLLSKVLDLKRQVDSEFYKYLNNIEFSNSGKKIIERSPLEKKDDDININVTAKDSKSSNRFTTPTRARVFISTGEFNFTKDVSSNKNFNFRIPMITSSTTSQKIYFYPEIPEIGKIKNDIDPKIKREKDKLRSYLKKEAETEKFGVIKLKINEEIILNYNKNNIRDEFGDGSIASLDLPGGGTILTFIEDIFENHPKVKFDPMSENTVRFPIAVNRNMDGGNITIGRASQKSSDKPLVISIGKSVSNGDYRIQSSNWTNKSRNKFRAIIEKYIDEKTKKIKEITIQCDLCNNDELRYFTSKGSQGGENLDKDKGTITFDKGSLEKIELIRKTKKNENIYLTINSRDIPQSLLFANNKVELSEIIEGYLKTKGLYDNNQNLIGGTKVCFQEMPITYHWAVPPKYRSKKLKILYNGKKIPIKNDGTILIQKKNTDQGKLFFEGNGLSIKKSLDMKNKTKGTLLIPKSYSIDKYYDQSIYLEPSIQKIGWDDVLIPGMSNFNLLKAEKNTKLWGVIKMFTFVALSGIAYSEYDLYQEHLEQYKFHQNKYNNCTDCLQPELDQWRANATNSYDLMIEHQTNQSIAMFGLGSLYTYNIIEFSMKIGKRRRK